MSKAFKPVMGESILATAGATAASTTVTPPSAVNAIMLTNTTANAAYLKVGYNPDQAITATVADVYIPASVVNFVIPIELGADKISLVRVGGTDTNLHIAFGMLVDLAV